MAKFTDAVKAAIAAEFEDGDIPEGADFSNWINAIQAGIQEHQHKSTGGTGSGTGDAAPIKASREVFIPANFYPDSYWSWRGVYHVSHSQDGSARVNYFTFRAPDNFASFTSIQLVWTTNTPAGNLYWRLEANFNPVGVSYLENSEDTALGVTANSGNNLFNVTAHPNPLLLAGLDKGWFVGIRLTRRGDLVQDTLGADVAIYGLLFTYAPDQ